MLDRQPRISINRMVDQARKALATPTQRPEDVKDLEAIRLWIGRELATEVTVAQVARAIARLPRARQLDRSPIVARRLAGGARD